MNNYPNQNQNQNQDHIYTQSTGTTATGFPPAPYEEKAVGGGAPPPAAHEPSYHQEAAYQHQQDPNQQTQPNMNQAQFKAPPPGFYEQQQQQQQQTQPGQNQTFVQPGQQQHVGVVPTELQRLQRDSDIVFCPRCGVTDRTRVEYRSGGTTHVAALIACFIACLGCIPYLVRSLKDAEHYCANCNSLLAVWHRSGHTDVVARTAPAVVYPSGGMPAKG